MLPESDIKLLRLKEGNEKILTDKAEAGLYSKTKRDRPFETASFFCEPAGTRTQGPYIKSVLLYQLSYKFNPSFNISVERSAKISATIFAAKNLLHRLSSIK